MQQRRERSHVAVPSPAAVAAPIRLIHAAATMLLATVLASCGSDGGGTTEPDPNPATTGSISVVASTTGDDPDANGYNVILADSMVDYDAGSSEVVNDSTVRNVGSNATATISELPPGDYMVLFDGLEFGCLLQGNGAVPVTVAAGDTTQIELAVKCGFSIVPGRLVVRTSTTGTNIDPDGYVVSVDLGDEQAIGVNEELRLDEAAAGKALVWLRGVADNCTVDGGDLHSIDLPNNILTTLQLSIACQ